jgi:ribonuclease HI
MRVDVKCIGVTGKGCVSRGKRGGLGFRDLEAFNKAVLAKQCWRVFKSPDSLAARLLKGCYFPTVGFLDAKSKNSDSFVWKSLNWGKELLVSGLRWRVGCGRDVRIYSDKWVPRPLSFRILSAPILGVEAKVEQLMLASGGWDISLIQSSFSPDDSKAILQIPLGLSRAGDSLMWHYDSTGNYKVKSGYRCWKALVGTPCASNSSRLEGWWEALWKLHIPLKIRIFVWRACWDWIPTLSNLERRHIQVINRCPMCNELGESILHALWGCRKLKFVRNEWLPPAVLVNDQIFGFLDFMLECFSLLKKAELELFCVIIWRLWFLRNSVVHGAAKPDLFQVLFWSKDLLVEFQELTSSRGSGVSVENLIRNSWRPPDQVCFKINCDAAVDVLAGVIGIGVAIRDSSGFVLASCSVRVSGFFDANMAEILAIRRGLVFSRECGLAPCVLESDAAVAVRWVTEGSHLESANGLILSEIASLVSSLSVISVSHVPRVANTVAYGLAKFALTNDDDLFWMEDFPPCVRREVQLDRPV